MQIRYIGSFPPPYGGVTVKNELLYSVLSERHPIKLFRKPHWMSNTVYQIANLLLALIPNQKLIIGISGKGGKSRLVTMVLALFGRQNMKRSIYFMMGGQEAHLIAKDERIKKLYACYKQILVETKSMLETLRSAGLDNVSLFPNCRKRPNKIADRKVQQQFRCIFFSLVQRMKGVDNILDVARQLPDVQFSIYGHVDSEYHEDFSKALESLNNIKYCGEFQGIDEEKYELLSQYDVILFPTMWTTEGVPGILVEAKIAGVPCIVSNVSYNAELVENNVEGIVLRENTPECLAEGIRNLKENREYLRGLSTGSRLSAEKYYIENYLDEIGGFLFE